jgi:ABC-type nickel/cobalt efflux system permease component RcnA
LEQQSGLSSEQKSLLVALFGGVIVAGIWFAVSMSIVTTIIFGLPIGAVGALVVYRTISRMSEQKTLTPKAGVRTSANGKLPEDKPAEATTPLKLK